MNTHTIETRTHGRYLVDVPAGAGPFPLLAGFHGYKENADRMRDELQRVRGNHPWLIVSVQALSRFYDRSEQVVGSWMTRQDRELVIADNIAYAAAAIANVRAGYATTSGLVYVGFSQGVAMAYRAAAFAGPATGVIALAGDVPPDVAPAASTLPPILIGRGTADEWYTPDKATADMRTLAAAGVQHEEHVFDGGHVWEATFIDRARAFVAGLPGF